MAPDLPLCNAEFSTFFTLNPFNPNVIPLNPNITRNIKPKSLWGFDRIRFLENVALFSINVHVLLATMDYETPGDVVFR